MAEGPISRLPPEMMCEILSNLSVGRDIASARMVSSSWGLLLEQLSAERAGGVELWGRFANNAWGGSHLVKTNLFHKRHLDDSLPLFRWRSHPAPPLAHMNNMVFTQVPQLNDYYLVGTSRGVLCLAKIYHYYIFNPTTSRLFRLQGEGYYSNPRLMRVKSRKENLWGVEVGKVRIIALGFGYDMYSQQFKAVRMVQFDQSRVIQREVTWFTLQGHTLEDLQRSESFHGNITQPIGIEHRGRILWIAGSSIISFSLCTDRVSQTIIPDTVRIGDQPTLGLIHSRPVLATVAARTMSLFVKCDGPSMKFWEPFLVIQIPHDIPRPFVPLGMPLNGVLLFQTGGRDHSCYFFDPQQMVQTSNFQQRCARDFWVSVLCPQSLLGIRMLGRVKHVNPSKRPFDVL